MSLDQLIKKLKPAFLDAASNERRSCRVFLSASDMKTRALTRHASADTPADAWSAAVDNLKAALGGMNPTILRADWVIDEQSMTWADFLTAIAQIRRNYYRRGLALDPEYKIAFIEPELTGNSMLYRDGKDGDPNCVFNAEACNTYCRMRFNCAFPTPAPSSTVFTFKTAGAFVSDLDDDVIMLDGEGLASDHRPINYIDGATILKLARNSAAFLAKEIKRKDPFFCDRYPRTDKILPMRTPFKHFNFIAALLDVYETYDKIGNSTLGAAITKAIQYCIKNYIRYRTLHDGSEVAYLVSNDDNDARVGANGAALIAFAKHAAVMKTKKYLQLMNELADGILSMQKDDGSFAHALALPDYSVKTQVNIISFDGLALLGLLECYELNRDQKLLDAVERAFNYLIVNEKWKSHDPRFEHAVDIITQYLPKREYFEFGIKNFADQIRTAYHQKYHDPRALELFIAADNLLERMKSMPEMSDLISQVNAEDLHATLERQVKALTDAIFYPEFAMFFKRPETIVDAFFHRYEAFRVMVVDMEFLFSSAVAYQQYLARRKHAPQPSATLLDAASLMPPLERLAHRLKAKVLESAEKNSHRPCRLFLSASDMKSRAITRFASADNPVDAWKSAVESLKNALGTIRPTILRADFVVESEQITWAEFNERIGKVKRNYFRKGLSLDQNFDVAFTASELNANVMLYRDGNDGSPFCIFRQDRSNEYCRRRFKCDFPKLEPNDVVYLFGTNGAFIADDLDEPLSIVDTDFAPAHRDLDQTDDALILNRIRAGADYLARNVRTNGQFTFGRYPCFDTVISIQDVGSHFGAISAMLDAYETYDQPTAQSERLRSAIERGLEYGIKEFVFWRQMPDGAHIAYVSDPKTNEIELGSLALALLALTRHCVFMKTDKHSALMNGLAEGIMSMQNPDGSFMHVLHSRTFSLKDDFRFLFFDGEAVLSLLRLYSITHDARLLAASELALRYFIETEHWRYHDCWLACAVSELTNYEPKREYFELGIKNFLPLLPFIRNRLTPVPTVMELTTAADAMIERMKSMPEMSDLLSKVPTEDFYAAMESRAKNLLDGHFYPETAMFFKRPESIVGAFFIRNEAFRVRIDENQHFIEGLSKYRKYLARRDHAPQPSYALLNDDASDYEEDEFGRLINMKNPMESIRSRILPMPDDFHPDLSSFAQELKETNGVIFFMLRQIVPKTTGLEMSSFRRAKLFREQFGIDVHLLTHYYQGDLLQQCAAYGLDFPIINFYDYYQEIDRNGVSPSSLVPTKTVDGTEGDVRFKDSYNELGFFGRRHILDHEKDRFLEALFYRRDGSVAVREVYDYPEDKFHFKLLELIDRNGKVTHSFNTRKEAISHWVLELVSDKSKRFYLVSDRLLEFYIAFEKMTEMHSDNVRVIHQLHNLHVLEPYDPFKSKAGYQYLYDRKVKADVILILTRRQNEDILKRFKLDNTLVLPHSLTAIPKITDVEYDPFRIVQVGRVVVEKGHAKSVEMMKQVLKYVPQATLHFYGSGSLQKSVQKLIDDEGLSDHIKFEGFVSNMPTVFASAALSILPSTFEGSPLVVQESMQQGCPVVAFNCTYGPDEVIEDGKSGYVVPVDDIDALADRVIRILTDDELRERLSKHCARSLEKFAPDVVARQWMWLFGKLLIRS